MQRQKIFYGWFVAAAGFAIIATMMVAFFSFGVFVKPLETDFGWSRGVVSSGYTVFTIGYAISLVVGGRLVDRYHPRLILLTSASLAGLGISLTSQISSIDQLRFFLFVAGLGMGPLMPLAIATVQRWFRDRRNAGMALAVVVSGASGGQLLFPPLINYFILSYGWRNAWLIAGILLFATIVIASFVIRPSPTEVKEALTGRESAKPVSAGGWGTGRALATLAYASVVCASSVMGVAFAVVVVHLVPYAVGLGMSSTAAATALSVVGGTSLAGRLVASFISNRIGWQRTLSLSCFGIAASLIWLLFSNASWMIYGFVVLFGAFWGIRVVAQMGILNEFFGLRSVGTLIGISLAVTNLVGSFAPYIVGFMFDTTGSYFVAFAIITALVFSGGLFIALMKKPQLTQKYPPERH